VGDIKLKLATYVISSLSCPDWCILAKELAFDVWLEKEF
jgi:hypothetical protein